MSYPPPLSSCVYNVRFGQNCKLLLVEFALLFFLSQDHTSLEDLSDCLVASSLMEDFTPFSLSSSSQTLDMLELLNEKRPPLSEIKSQWGWCTQIILQSCRNTEAFTPSKPSEFTEDPKSHVACQAVFIECPLGSHVLILRKHNIIFI